MISSRLTTPRRIGVLSRRRARFPTLYRSMASVKEDISHEQRTATEPRDTGLHMVRVRSAEQVNNTVRVIDFDIADTNRGVKFMPGQWLDTFVPGIPRAGGFTLTSTPLEASPKFTKHPKLQLAIQKSPNNPPAMWFWQPVEHIIGKEVVVRVGGSFVYPPAGMDMRNVDRVVFIAAGVGINPLISMLSYLDQTKSMPRSVSFLYTTKIEDGSSLEQSRILFLERLMRISKDWPVNLDLTLFVTGASDSTTARQVQDLPRHQYRRINKNDIAKALGDGKERNNAIAFVCGPPRMTDEMVDMIGTMEGMSPDRVFCERWW